MSTDQLTARGPAAAAFLVADGDPYPGADEWVTTSAGHRMSARTAWRVRNAVPRGTRRARRSRVGLFERWCAARGRVPTDPHTVPDYLTHLADLQHPASTLDAHLGTLAGWLALTRYPLSDEDQLYCRAVVDQRARTEATEDAEEPGALQAAEATPEDLAAMVATCGTNPVGVRNRFLLLLEWYMAGRASEPAALNRRDVTVTTAAYLDPATRRPVVREALVVQVRSDKTNPHGRRERPVRLLAQDTEALCPVAAWRAWSALIDAQGAGEGGPLLRRVSARGVIASPDRQPPGRPTIKPGRGSGIGDRTVRNVIAAAAEAADLVDPWTPEQQAVLSTVAEDAALSRLATAAEREAYRARLRVERRGLRRTRKRYSGHSMRRGCVRAMQRHKIPRAMIEQQARYVAGSRALDRYLDDLPDWADNPTAVMRL